MEADDPVVQLRSRCEQQRRLKDAGTAPAIQLIQHSSATSTRFLRALAELAKYKMAEAKAADELGRAVRAAIETRRATLVAGYAALHLSHRLLAQESDGDATGLLRQLSEEAAAARARVEAAETMMPPPDELHKLPTEEWRDSAQARDQVSVPTNPHVPPLPLTSSLAH